MFQWPASGVGAGREDRVQCEMAQIKQAFIEKHFVAHTPPESNRSRLKKSLRFIAGAEDGKVTSIPSSFGERYFLSPTEKEIS